MPKGHISHAAGVYRIPRGYITLAVGGADLGAPRGYHCGNVAPRLAAQYPFSGSMMLPSIALTISKGFLASYHSLSGS